MSDDSSDDAESAYNPKENQHYEGTTSQQTYSATHDDKSHPSGSSESALVPEEANGRAQTSLVQYLGPNSSYCGYCKRSERQSGGGRRSHGKYDSVIDSHYVHLCQFEMSHLLFYTKSYNLHSPRHGNEKLARLRLSRAIR